MNDVGAMRPSSILIMFRNSASASSSIWVYGVPLNDRNDDSIIDVHAECTVALYL
eukprot:COSAG01_NODE_52346_length_347_cov_0.826613_1_plen_54_part_10